MSTQRVAVNGIELAYDTFGDPGAPPVVLVMGLGTQMIAWPEPFCRQLAEQGHYVVRFDNRDIGESTQLDWLPAPSPAAVALRRHQPSYRLDDLAADTVGLLDALDLDRVYLVGASMGGFIAQLVALQRPDRIASLTLIMTSTGSRRVGRTKPSVMSAILRRRPATTREQAIEASVGMMRMIGSVGFPFDETRVRALAGESFDRGYSPDGQARQLAAVLAQTDRTQQLRRFTAPTLVIHGLADPLVGPSGGLALAKTIPGARLVGFHGMGHDLPEPLWPDLVREIVDLTRRGAAARSDESGPR